MTGSPRPRGRYLKPGANLGAMPVTIDFAPETRIDPGLDKDRRYTTPETMALCMRLAGVDGWDLDVAADVESHWANHWYGINEDGLQQSWFGRVWCNPPFSNIGPWVKMAWLKMADPKPPTIIAMLLPANRTEQPWWQTHVEPHRDDESFRTHFLPGRVRYGHPGNKRGHNVGAPPFGSVLLIWSGE